MNKPTVLLGALGLTLLPTQAAYSQEKQRQSEFDVSPAVQALSDQALATLVADEYKLSTFDKDREDGGYCYRIIQGVQQDIQLALNTPPLEQMGISMSISEDGDRKKDLQLIEREYFDGQLHKKAQFIDANLDGVPDIYKAVTHYTETKETYATGERMLYREFVTYNEDYALGNIPEKYVRAYRYMLESFLQTATDVCEQPLDILGE